MELSKTYTPNEIETKWYPIWESSGYFKPTFKDGAESYCIQLPPPNVTGTLHMGHGFQQTLMDILIRYHRMKGYNTLWQVGTDHAGIATQIVVERQLDAKGISRHDLGREEFIKKVWEWKEVSGNTITTQMRRLGASADWSREQFTMNETLSNAVLEVFVKLYDKGYIYRGKRLVNWDVKLQTAVSDLEVISEEANGSLWHIRYPFKDSSESIIVATTRPETMLGDVAVAVNPKDERYKHLIGKKLVLPLVGREIPVIADDYVDPEFGTGCVKITPAHDFNDYEMGQRHNLEMINIMTLEGNINENAPKQYQGMERFAARKQIVKDLEDQGYMVEIKPHKLMVPRGDRTNVVIEPLLTDQWFMKMDDFAKKGLDLVAKNKVNFVPENWTTIYDQWLENIKDWCISRQLWWGHRIPAFYDDEGNVYVAKTIEEATKKANGRNLRQDNDVLDTWFSSALWAFSDLGWPNETPELKAFLPSNVLITGFDIIFFWVARMIMLTDEFTGLVPFKEVYVTGLILDANGQKMSKSKGNTIDPLDLINGITIDKLVEKRTTGLMNPKQAETIAKTTKKDYPEGFQAFGADALRYTFASIATNNREIRFDVRKIESSRNFCNKIFNATKFVLMSLDNHLASGQKLDIADINKLELNFVDKWILSSLSILITDLETAYKTYRFDIAAQRLYEFVWNDFCDWYLELAKVNLTNSNSELKENTLRVLLAVMDAILKLLHPLIPFVTEELWQSVKERMANVDELSIMLTSYPQKADYTVADFAQSLSQIDELKYLITVIRNLRAEMNLNPGAKVPLIVEGESVTFASKLSYFESLAKISETSFVDKLDDNANAPIAIFNQARIMLKVEIDIAAEKLRLTREIEKINKELEKITLKMSSPGFAEKAPRELVEKESLRATDLSNTREALNQQFARLG